MFYSCLLICFYFKAWALTRSIKLQQLNSSKANFQWEELFESSITFGKTILKEVFWLSNRTFNTEIFVQRNKHTVHEITHCNLPPFNISTPQRIVINVSLKTSSLSCPKVSLNMYTTVFWVDVDLKNKFISGINVK